MIWFWMIVGLFALVTGAELLVRGASVLASAMRISSLVIGLTVVAFGTSAPEMAVSAVSSVRGEANIAVGNVVGSNIFNILFVLGASALIVPLVVSRQIIWMDVPLMIAVSFITYLLALNGTLSRVEGTALFIAIIAYTIGLIWLGRRSEKKTREESMTEVSVTRVTWGSLLGNVILILGGLALLVFGASQLVEASTSIARAWGVSDLVIGVTIVAVGTSLPEVATSLMAAFKGERDLAVGNVVGSNLFNLLGVLGLSAILSPNGISIASEALAVDIPVMVLVAMACWPIVITRKTVARWEGALMVLAYVIYTVYLVLIAEQNPLVDEFAKYLWLVGAPLAIFVFIGLTIRERRVAIPPQT